MSFADLGLQPELLKALKDKGYEAPTPIQLQAIPMILQGADLMAGSQTGTGKTAGFTLPLLQKLMGRLLQKGEKRKIRALILAPTRELALQIADNVRIYSKYLPLKTAVIFGGVNMNNQKRTLQQGVDILIATPGRLLDHVGQKSIDLSAIATLILDEADRMLDMGFIHDIKRIISLLPKERQSVLFSATFSPEIKALASQFLTSPQVIEVARHNAPAELISHIVHPVDQGRKKDLLSFLVSSNQWKQVLVFTRTKHGANRLAEVLDQGGIPSTAFHGNKSQGARVRALSDFKQGKVKVLVATDIAARGIDIHDLPYVVNYDLPYVPEDYIHRIGRTGRAGKEGKAISLVSSDERGLLRDIERLLKLPIEQTLVSGYEPQVKKEEPRPSAPFKKRFQKPSFGRKFTPRERNESREGKEESREPAPFKKRFQKPSFGSTFAPRERSDSREGKEESRGPGRFKKGFQKPSFGSKFTKPHARGGKDSRRGPR